nr:SAVED domain-containing protein [Ningiella sp. W23]
MLSIEGKSDSNVHILDENKFTSLELRQEEFESIKNLLIASLPDYYVDPQSIAGTLARLGKNAAAQKLLTKIPEVKKIRSGDLGEVITTDYIEESTNYTVPIRKLRWRDHRNMAMRGDDVIGIAVDLQRQSIKFLKAEAKANKALSRKVLQEARAELDLDEGLPAPHALEFVAERLRETGNQPLADLIEKVQLVDGIRTNQVEHLLFTFTASNPATLQKKLLIIMMEI